MLEGVRQGLGPKIEERAFQVVLFGSMAKGLGDADSDVNLLVVVDWVTPS